jgi:hypothetical protein
MLGHLGPLGGDSLGRLAGQVPHHLPPDGRIRIQ